MSKTEPINPFNFKDYKELHKTFDYDKKKATVLAEAMTERILLQKRMDELQTILEDNIDLKPFLWTTRDGKVLALHDIDDDHLKNILTHIVAHGGAISPTIKAEALSRGFSIPEQSTTNRAIRYLNAGQEAGQEVDGEIIDVDDIWDEQD